MADTAAAAPVPAPGPASAPSRSRAWGAHLIVLALAALALLLTLNDEGRDLARTQTIGLMLTTLVAALGLNLLSGYSGLISLGQGAFVAIGAYATAVFRVDAGLPWLVAGIAALLVCGVVGAGIAVAAARLHGPQLAMVTLVFAVVVHRLLVELPRFGRLSGYPNRADHGSGLVDPPRLFGHAFEPPLFAGTVPTAMILVVAGAVVAFTLCRNIARSSWGRSLRAIETSEIMASQVGVNVSHRKLAVTVLAAVYGGGAGILYLLIYGHLQPESFTLFLGVNLLVAVILGGSGSLLGPVVGAAAVALLSDSAILDELVAAQQRALSETWYLSGEGLVALIMLVVLLVLPRGIWGTIHHRAVSRRRARRAHTHVEPNEPAASALQSGDPTSEDASTPAPTPTAVLAVSGFGKSFGGNRAVDAMDLTVRAGEVHAVIGPNGAGKSTLANLISGLYHSDSGSAVLQGHEIRSLAPHEISRLGVGRTFQTPLLDLERSCSENVLLGSTITGSSSLWRSALRLPATIRRERSETERARELLRLVGLGAASDTPAGDLSYGQQRSLEIARALAGSPALVIMDEPGAGLNPHERGVLADLITAIADSGTAVVLVEHHMDLVRSVASRVTCMAEGTTLASGSVDSVLADPAVIESYLGASRTEPSSSPDDVATGQLEDGHV